MEGPGRDRPGWDQAVQTLAQLARGLAGEGDRQHVLGPSSAGDDPIADPASEHPRLASARRSEDADGRRRGGDCEVLRRREVGEQVSWLAHGYNHVVHPTRRVGR